MGLSSSGCPAPPGWIISSPKERLSASHFIVRRRSAWPLATSRSMVVTGIKVIIRPATGCPVPGLPTVAVPSRTHQFSASGCRRPSSVGPSSAVTCCSRTGTQGPLRPSIRTLSRPTGPPRWVSAKEASERPSGRSRSMEGVGAAAGDHVRSASERPSGHPLRGAPASGHPIPQGGRCRQTRVSS